MRAFNSDSVEMDMGDKKKVKKNSSYGNPKISDNPNLNRRYKKQRRAILKRDTLKKTI